MGYVKNKLIEIIEKCDTPKKAFDRVEGEMGGADKKFIYAMWHDLWDEPKPKTKFVARHDTGVVPSFWWVDEDDKDGGRSVCNCGDGSYGKKFARLIARLLNQHQKGKK